MGIVKHHAMVNLRGLAVERVDGVRNERAGGGNRHKLVEHWPIVDAQDCVGAPSRRPRRPVHGAVFQIQSARRSSIVQTSSQAEIETSTAMAPATARRTNPVAMAKTSRMTDLLQPEVVRSHETGVGQQNEKEGPSRVERDAMRPAIR